jgi:hypothetical protein
MSYSDQNGQTPANATGAYVLSAQELQGAQWIVVVSDNSQLTVTTLDFLGEFLGSGTVIALAGDVIGTTGTNTVQAIGGHTVDLGGSLTTGGPVAFEGAFSWVGNVTGPTNVTFPEGTNDLGTMSSFTVITNSGTQVVTQGETFDATAGTGSMSDWVAGTGFLNSGTITNGQTANVAALSGDVTSINTDGTIATTVTAVGGHLLTLAGTAVLPAGTMLANGLASGDIFVGNGSGVATAVAMSGDATISNTGAIAVGKTNGVSFGTLATLNAAPAGTLTGTTLASNVVSSSLTSVGTIGTGTWQGTAIGYPYLPASADIATIPFPLIGSPLGGQSFMVPVTQAGTLLANGGSGFTCFKNPAGGVNPTATWTLLVQEITNAGSVTTLGTISISSAGSVTAPTFSNTAIAADSGIAITNQATADASAAYWSIGFQFQKT